MRILPAVLSAIALCIAAAPARAQEAWPTKPLRIIHGFGGGGPVDLLARMLAPVLSERLGQAVLVEGKPGAGGTLGAAYVAKSEPDGYTLLLMAFGHSAAPGLYKSLPYDAANDFTMISMVARSPFAIIAGPASPAASMQELMQKARAQPGKIDFGSAGVGSGMHLVAVLLQARSGAQMTHVPYKTATAVNLALLSGEIPILFTSVAGITPLLDSGKVKMLAVTGKERYSLTPGVPTVAAGARQSAGRKAACACGDRPHALPSAAKHSDRRRNGASRLRRHVVVRAGGAEEPARADRGQDK